MKRPACPGDKFNYSINRPYIIGLATGAQASWYNKARVTRSSSFIGRDGGGEKMKGGSGFVEAAKSALGRAARVLCLGRAGMNYCYSPAEIPGSEAEEGRESRRLFARMSARRVGVARR